MLNIPNGLDQFQIDTYKLAYSLCMKKRNEGKSITEAIDIVCESLGGMVSKDNLREFLLAEVTVTSTPSIGIVAQDIRSNKWWSELKNSHEFRPEYSRRYYDYMRQKPSWSVIDVDRINDSTDDVMNAIADPRDSGLLERIGLVFGYVQSGKTAHYISLINKAYDAGYKVIIVLTGIHNSLRSQTQARIDEEVLGYETSIEYLQHMEMERNQIGVGVFQPIEEGKFFPSLTTRDEKGDITKKTISINVTPPYIIVTKKISSVLNNLIAYFNKTPIAVSKDGKKIIPGDYPVLIIDDEADQASINTNATRDKDGNYLEEYNPSTINKLIRTLFSMFERRSYVGYTATPFANIFIDPKSPENAFGSDLFPRDFVFRAPKSGLYIGASEYFGFSDDESAPTMPLFRPIESGTDYLGKGTKADDPVGPIPEDMKEAIKYFLISTAVRNLRGQRNKPNTMLIHVIRFVAQQNKLRKRVKDFYDELDSEIRYGDTETVQHFQMLWANDYIPTTIAMNQSFSKYMKQCSDLSWDVVWEEIVRLVRAKEIRVYSVNGKSEDSLIYKNNEGRPFNVIAIGGDKLSRGLTLEGLTISYFTRSSSTYDTLMQMGRWFGFRPGYIDACRLFTTRKLYGWFSHISMATEDLADQFDFMNDVDQNPEDFGLRVATHPDLLITARNKLRTGEETSRDFSGKLSQTRAFDVNTETIDHNFEAVESLLQSIGNPISPEEYEKEFHRQQPGKHLFWRHVSGHAVSTFFEDYETSAVASRANSHYMAEYVRDMNKVGGLTDWTVCLMNITRPTKPNLSVAGYNVGAGIFRENGHGVDSSAGSVVSIHTMTSKDNEYFDYSKDDIIRKDELVNTLTAQGVKGISERVRIATRHFEKGLLLLYPIADAGELTENLEGHKTPFGFAAVFPDRKNKGHLKAYRLNDVAMEKDSDELYS